jgi:hypothetical protein
VPNPAGSSAGEAAAIERNQRITNANRAPRPPSRSGPSCLLTPLRHIVADMEGAPELVFTIAAAVR